MGVPTAHGPADACGQAAVRPAVALGQRALRALAHRPRTSREVDVMTEIADASTSGSFDEHHPPRRDLLDDCVHCGFCLPTCPTYTVTGEEMESPRGRIYLMDLAARGEVSLDQAFGNRMDSCLGCLACMSTCP